MLLELARRFMRRSIGSLSPTALLIPNEDQANEALEKAVEVFNDRRYRESVDAWKAFLKFSPHNVGALNNLGLALAALGREHEAIRYFDQAYSLDDSHLPSLVNYVNVLRARQDSTQGLELLRKARLQAPELAGLRAAYGSILFGGGNSEQAVTHSLHAWLGDFDSPHSVDQFLWISTYWDTNEARQAAEHRFWAGTLKPRPHDIGPPRPRADPLNVFPVGRRLRVGYWSPDLREHSVRYFFRPLLEGHDRTRVEIFLYYDHHVQDVQTELMKAHADHFQHVAQFSDERLAELLHRDRLDVLVELAGHTSANRIDMLRYRFAPLQVTGLGYPPTTGLSTIDAKLLDCHLQDSAADAFYSEIPAFLPHSFWCFDPKAEIAPPPPPPVLANGYITFGCFGNVGKITAETLSCWGAVLARVPGSRLVIRAVNFADPLHKSMFMESLERADIPLARVDLRAPTPATALFQAYGDEIDIVLDTFPFNGGTTTCFATYAGVPVITRKSRALASRMGESVMTNLGLADWVTDSAATYVDRAVEAAQDVETLKRFRKEARQRFFGSALGNGALYASDVEDFYFERLRNPPAPKPNETAFVLPAKELVRRARATMHYGNFDAARRIVNYCLDQHPRHGAAHILWTERLTGQGLFADAADYLHAQYDNFDNVSDQIKALVNEARFRFVARQPARAAEAIDRLAKWPGLASEQRAQLRLLQIANGVQLQPEIDCRGVPDTPAEDAMRNIAVCVVTDDVGTFERIARQVEGLYPLSNATIHVTHCLSDTQAYAYQCVVAAAEVDVLVCVHANVDFWRKDFWHQLSKAFRQCDIVGTHGAKRWDRLEWRSHGQEQKAGAFLIPSGEQQEFWEVYAFSQDIDGIAAGLEVVDGSFMAVNLHSIRRFGDLVFEEDLNEAGALMEEYFCVCAARRGLRVGVSAQLGISLNWRVGFNDRYLGQARLFVAEQLGFEPWFFPEDEQTLWSVSLPSAELAARTLQIFCDDVSFVGACQT